MEELLREVRRDVREIKEIVTKNRDEEVQRLVAVETRSKYNRWLITFILVSSIGTYIGKVIGFI